MNREPFEPSLPSEERSAELTRLLGHARADVPAGKEWEGLAASVSSIWSTPLGDPPSGDAVSHEPTDLGSPGLGAGSATGAKPVMFTSGVFKAVGAVALAGAVATGGWRWARSVDGGSVESGNVHTSRVENQSVESNALKGNTIQSNRAPETGASVASDSLAAPILEPASSGAVGSAEIAVVAQVHRDPPLTGSARTTSGRKLPPPPNELRLLQQAREELGRNPKQTLALCRKHEQLFPSGQLAQEREVLAIEALRRLQRDEEAAQKTQRFDKAFPDSPHQSRVRRSEP